jgi:molybdopterin-dependent oxidoreductase iron-sulfur protein
MADHTVHRIQGYCALCVARCGTVATVEDGRLTRLDPDPAHPTGQALCAMPGYDPFGPTGANYNLLIGTTALDPVSGTPSHRSYLCEIRPVGREEN